MPTQVKRNQLDTDIINGWIPANEAWTYASANTITVPSGAAAKYAKGDKVKLTQTTVKYFYIVGVADTVLTVVGETSAIVVANAAISANYYSHANKPVGFPSYFSWTPTLNTGNADLSGYDYAYYSIEGCRLSLFFNASNRSLSGSAGTIIVGVPVTVALGTSGQWGNYTYYTGAYTYARCLLDGNGMNLHKGMTSESWVANETGVYINVFGSYWI
jgi:hypothetical protein